MSRVANTPVELPSSVEVKLDGQDISVKGTKGEMSLVIHNDVELTQDEGVLKVASRNGDREGRKLKVRN
jgi:large subunit ribosomal protein L6